MATLMDILKSSRPLMIFEFKISDAETVFNQYLLIRDLFTNEHYLY
jgi:hypothetical protein